MANIFTLENLRWATSSGNLTPPSSGQRDSGWTFGQDGIGSYDNVVKLETYRMAQYLFDLDLDAPLRLEDEATGYAFVLRPLTPDTMSVRNGANNASGHIVAGDGSFDGQLTAQRELVLSGITTGAIGTDQHNYDADNMSVIAVAASSAFSFTGIAGGVEGRILQIINTGGTNSITLEHEHASSSSANRMALPGDADVIIGPSNRSAVLIYQGGKWKLRSKNF